MKIGIFSGSFNPIHLGHLILANYIVEFTEIDEVWFLVTPHNPLKESASLLDEQHRLQMVKLALEGYDKLKASDFELNLPKPSYTVSTLEKLREEHPEHEFVLIIGADNWDNFDKWRNYEEILDKHEIKVYPRLGYRISIPSKVRGKVDALESPIVEVSSTFIREGIDDGKNMRAFMDGKVNEYILKNKLYRG